MRLLHVSDWHVGRQTYRCSRVPDHEAALAEIVELARETRPHRVLDLPGADGEVVRIAFLPFVHANRMVDRFEDASTWTATYSERIQRIEDELDRGLAAGYDASRHVLLFAAHLYVSGARFSGSER